MTDLEKAEALAGGVELTVIKRDKSTEQVRVKQLPVRLIHQYAEAFRNESKIVQIVTGKDEKWVEQLSDASFEQIVEEGDRLNEYFFGRWMSRQRSRAEKIVPEARHSHRLRRRARRRLRINACAGFRS